MLNNLGFTVIESSSKYFNEETMHYFLSDIVYLEYLFQFQSTVNGEFGENTQNVPKAVEVENSQDQDLNHWLKVTEEHVLASLLK